MTNLKFATTKKYLYIYYDLIPFKALYFFFIAILPPLLEVVFILNRLKIYRYRELNRSKELFSVTFKYLSVEDILLCAKCLCASDNVPTSKILFADIFLNVWKLNPYLNFVLLVSQIRLNNLLVLGFIKMYSVAIFKLLKAL